MPNFLRSIQVLGVAVILGTAMPVFAESAPVYDADSMPQFDSDQNQDYPPPPAPGQERESGAAAYVPNQDPVGAPSAHMSMDQRVKRVEQQVNNMQTNDSTSRLDSLQDQIQTLRGQVEELTHQLQQAKTQQKSMYTDLETRVAQPVKPAVQSVASTDPATPAADDTLNPTSVAANDNSLTPSKASNPKKFIVKPPVDGTTTVTNNTATKSSNTADQPNVAEEQQIYQTAYNLIKAKKYNDAVTALQSMLQKYPSGQFASNAHYWLGELYGLMGKNDQALTEFSSVVSTYPESPRVSDAQLKVGLIYASQSKWTDAKSSFRRVINHYPGTAPARLAAEQLKQIKSAGH